MTDVYKKEIFPENEKYVMNTEENRSALKEAVGPSILTSMPGTYIKVDTEKREWNPSPDFAWLYRNQPPIVKVKDLVWS